MNFRQEPFRIQAKQFYQLADFQKLVKLKEKLTHGQPFEHSSDSLIVISTFRFTETDGFVFIPDNDYYHGKC